MVSNSSDFIYLIQSELNMIDSQIENIISSKNNPFLNSLLSSFFSNSKKFRSIVTISVLKMIFSNVSFKQLKICALIELIHNASLIHDDIIDNSDIRRNKPSFNIIFGNKKAVLSGDYILSLVFKELCGIGNTEIMNLFADALINICSGEIEQLSEQNKIVSIDRYIQKSQQKTAELFKLALECSFIVENQKEYLNFAEKFGNAFGIAFQIRDDINDIILHKSDKPVLNDLKNGIYTAPVIYFLEGKKTFDDAIFSLDKLKKSKAINNSENLCNIFINQALDLLKDFSDNHYKNILVNLLKILKKG